VNVDGNGRWRLVGLSAQALTTLATFLPLLFGRPDVLVRLVIVMAVAASLSPAMTMAAQTRIPVARTSSELAETRAMSRWALFVFSLMTALGGLWFTDPGTAIVTGLLCYTTGTYLVSMAIIARRQRYQALMRARFSYAAISAVATFALCLVHAPTVDFLLAPCVGYVVGASFGWSQPRAWRAEHARLASLGAEAVRAAPLSGAILLSGVSGQIGAFATSNMGALASGWATSIRLTSGFQNVGIQIVQPEIDIAASKAVRDGDVPALRTAFHRGLRRGVLLYGVAAPIVAGTGAFVIRSEPPGDIAVLVLGVILYQCSSLLVIPVERVLAMAGGYRKRVLWDVTRLLVYLPALVIPEPVLVIVWLSAVAMLSCAALLLLIRRQIAANERLEAHAH
jgi:hypothetical protein